MASSNRQQVLVRLHKHLKQHYKPIVPNVGRPVLEQVLFACCLENAGYDVAERAFSKLGESFFDYNEVRVTTVTELGETLRDLPFPQRSALGLRRVLQAVFESSYSFSLEHTRKQSIASGLKTLEHLHGIPPFVVSFVASTCLGGHSIPLDDGALGALFVSGVITREEYDAGNAPWLERAIAKKQGVEFSSLLHQFGAEIVRNVHAPLVRKIALAVDPAAKDRLPKRGEPLAPRNPPPVPQGRDGKRAADAAEELRPAGPQAASRPAGKTPMPSPAPKTGKPGPKPFVVKPNVGRPITIKPQAPPPVEAEEAARPKSAPPPAAPKAAAKAAAANAAKTSKGSGGSAPKKAQSGKPTPVTGGRAGTKPAKGRAGGSGGKPVVGSGKNAQAKGSAKSGPKAPGGGKSAGASKSGRRDGATGGGKGRASTGRKGSAELAKKKPR